MVDYPDDSRGEAAVKEKRKPPVTGSGKDYVEWCNRDSRQEEPVDEGHNPPEIGGETHHALEELSKMLPDCAAYIPDMFKNAERAAAKDHHV